jgi:hypothetical protein
MNRTTIIFVLAAVGSVGGAVSMRPKVIPPASFEDTGEMLFSSFTDPTLATGLEVVTWDDKSAKVVRFAVEQKDGRWVIPSHNDYPADGTARMGKAAASFIDVKKDIYYGDNAADHAKFGVLDPEGEEGKGDEKGKRVTIKDTSGTVLVDVVVGKTIEGKQHFRYVRLADQKRVYGVRLENLDISTNFADWIEKDLLKVKRDEIKLVRYDPYTVDEQAGKVTGQNPVLAELHSVDGKDEWVAAAGVEIPSGKVLDSAKIRTMITAIAAIKIVGVRARPPRLTRPALQSKGFFVSPDGRLFGNEGEARIVTEDGVVFSLYFGEVTYETGMALSAGLEEGATSEETAAPEGEEGETKTANRFMFVDVSYDPTLDKSQAATPLEEPEPAEGEKDEPEGPKGEARAKQMQQRFDQWFYVIGDMSFKQIHKTRDELFKVAPAAKPDEKKPAGTKPDGKAP